MNLCKKFSKNQELDKYEKGVVECVPDAKSKRIYITGAYKKSNSNQLLNIDINKSPQPTPIASFDSRTTKDSIYNSQEKVNTSLQKNNTRLSKGASDGLYQKKIAEKQKKKVYAKKEAQEVINTVIGSIDLGNGYYVDVITKKGIEAVLYELWKVNNKKHRTKFMRCFNFKYNLK